MYLYSVCICQSQSPSLHPLPPLGMHKFIFYICDSISLNFINKSINSINFIKKFICNLLLGSAYKWDHTVFVFLCLMCFIQYESVPVAANGIASFLFTNEWYSTVYMYSMFFMHSSVRGHLGCFQVLAILNSAGMNIGVDVSFPIMLCPGVGFLFFSQLPAKPELLH